MSQKAAKMCKSPKNLLLTDKVIEYEHLNTNCTIVGSNNLHLVKKPATLVTSVSPAYSNPSPGPYGSPASLKSPSPQLTMKPPTPQPTFPVMQIINPVITSRAMQQPQQNLIKLKPPLNILPKPSSSPQLAQQPPKPSVSPQIQVLPTTAGAHQQATIMQQPLLLNQMPMLAATPGVRFILQPQTAKISPQVQQVQQTPQGLILQPAAGQQLLQLQPPRSQPMVRVLTNGVGIPGTTYVTQVAPVQNTTTNLHHPSQSPSPKKKPPKKKKQKLDLANIMKLSGIGDDDDVLFESDASQSESDASTTPQPLLHQSLAPPLTQHQHQAHLIDKKPITSQPNIQIQHVHAQAQPQTGGTPIVQLLNQTFQQGAQQTTHQPINQSIPFSPFSIAPNFTIGTNGGLMVQRSGGFKLALGEDGRLVLQHDPTLNQDLQSQLLLQSIFGMNGSLVLQPSIDQQIHSQTVQTIQQQSVQTIQQQTVQSQTIQTVQHQIVQPQAIQSIQSQIQGQIQSLLQQQNLSLQPQQHNITLQGLAITSQNQQLQAQVQAAQVQQQQQLLHNHQLNLNQKLATVPVASVASVSAAATTNSSVTTTSSSIIAPFTTNNNNHTNTNFFSNSLPTISTTSGTSGQPVLKVQPFQKSVQPPVQTVHPIHHQSISHHQQQHPPQHQQNSSAPPTSYVVNLTPDQLEQLKRNGQLTVNGQTIFMQRPNNNKIDNAISEKKTSPKIKPLKKPVSKIAAVIKDNPVVHATTSNNVVNHATNTVISGTVGNLVTLTKSGNNLDKTINSVAAIGGGQGKTVVGNKQPAAIIQPSVVNFQPQTSQPAIVSLNQGSKLITTTGGSSVSSAGNAAKVIISPTTCTPIIHSSVISSSSASITPITPIIAQAGSVHAIGNISMPIVASRPSGVSIIATSNVPTITSSVISHPGIVSGVLASSTSAQVVPILSGSNVVTMTNAPSCNTTVPNVVPTASIVASIGNLATITTAAASVATSIATTQTQTARGVATESGGNHPEVERFLGQLIEETQLQQHATPIQIQPRLQLQSVACKPKLQVSQLNQTHQNATIVQAQQPTSAAAVKVVQSLPQRLPVVEPNQCQMTTSPQSAPQLIIQPQVSAQQSQPPLSTQTQSQQQQPLIVSTPLVLPSLPPSTPSQPQRVHTIQLTPQKQQHLKSIQLQIQTLSARMTPGNVEMQTALKLLFQEQQKILASGKLLPPDKVFYHGNQLIVNNSGMVKNEVLSPPLKNLHTQPEVKAVQPIQPKPEPQEPPTTSSATATSMTSTATSSHSRMPLYTKAQLIEQQMNTDQNGAIKPDIHTPFRDKTDACKRLIRYHCYEQPVLSEKDLDKADEIFELTARHFIGKFGRMVDKYRFLLHKESQRHVQTSELMMLDRMFLSEEQQSLIKLRQEIDECNMEMQLQEQLQHQQPTNADPSLNSEDYDEWTCIQRELGCLPIENSDAPNTVGAGASTPSASQTITTTSNKPTNKHSTGNVNTIATIAAKKFDVSVGTSNNTSSTSISNQPNHLNHQITISQATKRPLSASSNDKYESKKFRAEKTSKQSMILKTTSSSTSASSVGASETVLAAYQTGQNGLQSAEATRFVLKSSTLTNTLNNAHTHGANTDQSSMFTTQSNSHRPILHHQQQQQQQHIIQNQHFNATSSSTSNHYATIHQQRLNMQQYSSHQIVQHITHTVHHSSSSSSTNGAQTNCLNVNAALHHHQQQQQQHQQHPLQHSYNSCSLTSTLSSSSASCSSTSTRSNNEENDSIDEQVQSAIDSILNLQQNNLDLDETMQNMLS